MMLRFFVNNYAWKVSWLLLLPAHTPSLLPPQLVRSSASLVVLDDWIFGPCPDRTRPAPPPRPRVDLTRASVFGLADCLLFGDSASAPS